MEHLHLITIMGVLSAGAYAEAPAVKTVTVTFSEAKGLGVEAGVMRRDPSDIIKVSDSYYVWYTKGAEFGGYNATIWYATSTDGRVWTEKGEALARGAVGSWDQRSVFTPNILVAEGRYWLFFTAVPETFVPRGPNTTPTAIGVAVSDAPDGTWEKLAENPVLKISADPNAFDSLRVDDACLIVRNNQYWIYYKGRQQGKSPAQTKMGVAMADKPQGPYVKYVGNPVILGNHEVLVWPQAEGIAAMIGTTGPKRLTRTIQYAEDGLHFRKTYDILNVPVAAGAYRPEAFTQSGKGEMIEWGVHIKMDRKRKNLPCIERFECFVVPAPRSLGDYQTRRDSLFNERTVNEQHGNIDIKNMKGICDVSRSESVSCLYYR